LVRNVDGFDAYLSTISVSSPQGNYTQQRLVFPALKFFVAATYPMRRMIG